MNEAAQLCAVRLSWFSDIGATSCGLAVVFKKPKPENWSSWNEVKWRWREGHFEAYYALKGVDEIRPGSQSSIPDQSSHDQFSPRPRQRLRVQRSIAYRSHC